MLAGWLITMFGKRAGLAKGRLLPYIIALLALVLSGWLLWNTAFNYGVETTEIKYQKVILEEQHRQIEANETALEQARLKAQELERLLNERDAEIADIHEQGAADPNADRTAIGVDSVLRINRIR